MLDLNQFSSQGAHGPKVPNGPHDPISAFLRSMEDNGITCHERIIADGKIHRFAPNGNKHKKNGWYVLHTDHNFQSGHFGDWSKGDEWVKWSSVEEFRMSAEQQAIQRQREDRLRRQRIEEYNATAQECRMVWDTAKPAESDFPYLQAKKVPSHGLKIHPEGFLLVPMFNNMGEIRSLQRIWPDGSKKHWYGGEAQGNYFVIPGNQAECFICEGYATGATIHKATGGMVVVAFTRVNLLSVSETIKAKYPTSRITICADNDQFTEGNPGVSSAQDAGKKLGVKVVWPEFKDLGSKPTDFNDLASLEGIEQVKVQIKGKDALFRVRLSEWTMDAFQGEPPVREWLVEDTIPLSAVTIIAAMGDTGKGIMSLNLALQVTCGYRDVINRPIAFGHEVMAKGTAVYFTAEDDKSEIHRRLNGLDSMNRRNAARDKLIIVPLPNAGGPIPLVVPGKHGPESTMLYNEIRQQLLSIHDLKLVIFDPMASFILADINTDPAAGAFTTGLLSSLATETGAAIVVCHHMTKDGKNKVETLRQAREKIRGTSAIVDGVRSAYAIWPADSMDARKICRKMNAEFEENKVFFGGVVKSNGPADRNRKIMIRNDQGLLCVIDDILAQTQLSQAELDQILVMEIQHAASTGHPFTQSGTNGIIKEQKHRLCNELKTMSEKKIDGMVIRLLEAGGIVKCSAKGSTAKKWLDVPAGKFALGIGEFELGKADTMDDENE